MTLKSILALSILFAIGCGGNFQQPQTAQTSAAVHSAYFNTSMTGQTWNFADSFGNVLHVTIEPAQFCEAGICDGKSVIWHYRKDQCGGYWQPGICGAELWFVLHEETDGSWRSIASKITSIPFGPVTQNVLPVAGKPLPYVIVPASAGSSTGETEYLNEWQSGVLTDAPVVPNMPTGYVSWRTDAGVDADGNLLSEQSEGCTSVGTACFKETWTFAAGKGMVKIVPKMGGSAIDPRLTMIRY